MSLFFRAFLILAAICIAVPVASVATGFFLKKRAEDRARLLCSAIKVGFAEADTFALGYSKSRNCTQTSEGYKFFFQGWVFNGSECVVPGIPV
jgi:hypothetical protein